MVRQPLAKVLTAQYSRCITSVGLTSSALVAQKARLDICDTPSSGQSLDGSW